MALKDVGRFIRDLLLGPQIVDHTQSGPVRRRPDITRAVRHNGGDDWAHRMDRRLNS